MVGAIGLGFAARVLYTQAGPVVPALDSYWVAIHVTAAVAASGLFIVGGVAAALFLIRKDGPSRLPARADLERVAHRVIVIAFPIWTFAVISGALWADKAWGRYWGWDPKEVWAFITWVAYAAYLHARATAGWKGKAAMIVSLIAFACLMFNLVGVNIFIGGLHSYADVEIARRGRPKAGRVRVPESARKTGLVLFAQLALKAAQEVGVVVGTPRRLGGR